jgi:hypothetical protein
MAAGTAAAAVMILFWTGIGFVTAAAAVADFAVAAVAIRPFVPSYARPPYSPH